MALRHRAGPRVLGVLLCVFSRVASAPGETAPNGIVVEELGEDSALTRAGVRTGDVLTAWERVEAGRPLEGGRLVSVFDWEWWATEMAPRGAVRLTGHRQGEPVSATVVEDVWDTKVRPRLSPEVLGVYEEGRRKITAGRLEDGLGDWRRAITAARAGDAWHVTSWFLLRTGEVWTTAGAFEQARALYEGALETARDARARSVIYRAIAGLAERQNDRNRAYEAYREAFEICETRWGRSLVTARSQRELGRIAWQLGRRDEGYLHIRQAFEVVQELAPRSRAFAVLLNFMGNVALGRGKLSEAESYYRRTAGLWQEITPGSAGLVNPLTNLGSVVRAQGRLAEAEKIHLEALTRAREQPPGEARRLDVASISSNLGNVARDRGDYDRAEEYFRRALATWEELRPESQDLGAVLADLANIAADRGDFELAKSYYERDLEISEKLSDPFRTAFTLRNLASTLAEMGAFPAAQGQLRRAEALFEDLAPQSLFTAGVLQDQGNVAQMRGDFDLAAANHARALAIYEQEIPQSVELTACLSQLGLVMTRLGRYEEAELHYRRALAIHERLATQSYIEAQTLHRLGLLRRLQGEPGEAAAAFRRAIDVLEDQIGRLGGSHHVRGGFRALYKDVYQDALTAALELSRPEEAFQVLERSRARSLLAMLAERDLTFDADLPPELEKTRRDLNERSDHLLRQLRETGGAEGESAGRRRALADLRQDREALEFAIRKASPRFAEIRYPRPLSLAEARESLEPGTAVLAYSVGRDRTWLFVIDRARGLVMTKELELGEQDLSRKVEAFRRLLLERRDAGSPFFRTFDEAAKELFEALVAPAAEAVGDSERLLFVPDGALHLLPFAALRRPGGSYLLEWKPFSTVISLTLHARLRRTRADFASGAGTVRLAAFGDPRYSFPQRTGEARRGLSDWRPLPYTRDEVERIEALFPPRATRVHLGDSATEEAARALGSSPQLVHFAVHGHLDDRFPLSSALVFSVPEPPAEGRENGLLQVWEIFESVRIEADLAVLSACDSALGQERGGEGLTGLVRAFQYAGARNVAASLWSVDDRITAELMVRFYRHLVAGESYGEALRSAQLELLRAPVRIVNEDGVPVDWEVSAPYYWASFQLFGAGR